MPTTHLLIKGKVQGVFYRASAKKIADKINITGWVKNTIDGDVEITVTGNEEQLNEFINWCKQGPEKSKVENVIATNKPEEIFSSFEIVRW